MDAPKSVTAGTAFAVKLFFSKGGIQSFSRLFQDLPDGLQAQSVKSANADFSFQDRKIRMIWFKLPETDTFSVAYSVDVDKRLKGKFLLGGTFSYIDNGERKSVQLPETEITIQPSPLVDPRLIVDIKDFKKKAPSPVPAVPSSEIFCLRSITPSESVTGELIVTLLISKGKLTSFGKVEDTIPEGFTAAAIDKKEALFSVQNGMARFLWINLPAEPWFTVSYRLTPQPGVTPATYQPAGAFSYISQNKTQVTPVSETNQPLAKLKKTDFEFLVKAVSSGQKDIPLLASAETTAAQALPVSNETNHTATIEKKSPAQTTGISGKKEKKKAAQESAKEKAILAEADKKESVASLDPAIQNALLKEFLLLPEKGLYFRVQIAASRQVVNLPGHFRKFKIHDEVRIEKMDDWYKYTVGSFITYEEAKKYRESLSQEPPFKDAFIVAYRDGKRIPVQEALNAINTPVQ